MEKLLIDGRPFFYEPEILTYEVSKPMSPEDGKKLLYKIKELFDNKGLFFSLAFGTLLGAIREKGIIPGDEDLDIFVDNEEGLLHILEYLKENDVLLVRAHKGKLYSFRMGENSYIDVYILRPINKLTIWTPFCLSLSCCYTPKRYFKRYETIEFLGTDFQCPQNPEKIVEFWYGKDWKTPVRGHKFYYEVKSHYFWKNYIWPFMFECIGWPHWRHLVSSRFDSHEESMRAWNGLYHKK